MDGCHLIGWMTIMSLMSACSGGGRVTMVQGGSPQIVSQEVEAQTSVPDLTAQTASEQISRAKDNTEIATIVAKIRNGHAPAFQWAAFWEALEKRAGLSEVVTQSSELISLSQLSCRPDDYRAFAEFLLSWEITLDPLVSPDRSCAVPLTLSQRRRVLSLLKERLMQATLNGNETEQGKISLSLARFLALENSYRAIEAGDVETEDQSLLTILSSQQWQQVAESLSREKHTGELMSLIEIQQRGPEGDSSPLMKTLAGPMISDSLALKRGIKSLGYVPVLRILSGAKENIYNGDSFHAPVAVASLQQLLDNLTSEFLNRLPDRALDPLVRKNRWRASWEEFLLLRQVARPLERRLPAEYLLGWLEQLHRGLEMSFKTNATEALAFLNEQIQPSVDSVWILYRLLKSQKPDSIGSIEADALPDHLGALDTIVLKRVRAHLAKSPENMHKAQQEYCDTLKAFGIAEKVVSWNQFKSDPRFALSARGCVRIETASVDASEPLVATLNISSMQMPFDSRVRIPEAHVSIRSEKFDGSMFDLSYDEKIVSSAKSLTRDAQAVPVVFCVDVARTSGVIKAGRNCFPAHLTLQDALNGGEGERANARGSRAGSLSLQTGDSSQSFAPASVALEAGGKGDRSEMDFSAIESWFESMNAMLARTEPQFYFRPETTVSLMRAYWKNAAVDPQDSHLKKIYIHPGYLDYISSEQSAKIRAACSHEPDLKTCFEKDLGVKLHAVLSAALKDASDANAILDLQRSSFDLPAASDGMPKNALKFEGFQDVEGESR